MFLFARAARVFFTILFAIVSSVGHSASKSIDKKSINWLGPDDELFPAVIFSQPNKNALSTDPFSTNPSPTPAPSPSPTNDPIGLPPMNGGGTDPFGGGGGTGNPFPSPSPFPTPSPFPLPGGNGGSKMMSVAQVPAEFSCPLFESNPYNAMFTALDQMTQAVQLNPDCQEMKGFYEDASSNSERIRNAITSLQNWQQNPSQITPTTAMEVQRLLSEAVVGVTNISTNLQNNKLFNNSCGKNYPGLGKFLVAFSDLTNNLAPVALAFAAVNPAITMGVRLALLGGVVGAGTITAFRDYLKNSTLDMNNPEQRKAVLQNTCQFVKIYQKINYLRYKDEDNLSQIRKNLDAGVRAHQQRYQAPSSGLLPMLRYRYNTEKMFGEIEMNIARDRSALNYYRNKIKNFGADDERICLLGDSIVRITRIPDNSFTLGSFGGPFGGTATITDSFPMSVIANLDKSIEAVQQLQSGGGFPGFTPFTSNLLTPVGTDPFSQPPPGNVNVPPVGGEPTTGNGGVAEEPSVNNPDPVQPVDEAEQLFQAYRKSFLRVSVLAKKVLATSEVIPEMKACSDETKRWLDRISDVIDYTSGLVNSEQGSIEAEMQKNEEYKAWAVQYEKLKSEKKTIDTVTKVLREMANPEAVYIRSELAQRASQLKSALFSNISVLSVSPVEAWLNNNTNMHENSISDFLYQASLLGIGAKNIKATQKPPLIRALLTSSGPKYFDTNFHFFESVSRINLSAINLNTVKIGTQEHVEACQGIRLAVQKYNEARDYIGAAQFMCDMVDDVTLDTNAAIIRLCRGSAVFNGTRKSELQKYLDRMALRPGRSTISMNDFAGLLKKKLKQLQCQEL